MNRSQEVPEPDRVPLPRWVTPVLAFTAIGLLPWTLYLTFTLPARHVTQHYDLAWVGFDIALAASIAATAWAAVRSSQWLVPLAAATGTMLVCDAWFDLCTPGRTGMGEAIAEAVLAEVPLAPVLAPILIDTERLTLAT